jgi:hypothetical protein
MARSFISLFALLFLSSFVTSGALAQGDDSFELDDLDCNDDDDIDDDDNEIVAELVGYCEVPSVSSTAQGRFQGTIDDSATSITWTLTYRDLSSPTEQAHIHFGQEHTNGGISVFLCTNLGNGPTGVQACPQGSGTITGTLTAAEVVGPTDQGIAATELAELVSAIRAGSTYVNVHTQMHPSGEIRGQIVEDDHDDD